MKDTMSEIAGLLSRDNVSLVERALKTSEETGELASAVLSYTRSPGCEYKQNTVEDIVDEAADTIICGLSVALHANPKLTETEFIGIINRKLAKWDEKLQESLTLKVDFAKESTFNRPSAPCEAYDYPTGVCTIKAVPCRPDNKCCNNCDIILHCNSDRKCTW